MRKLVSLVILFILISCSNEKSDQSLTFDDYQKLGIPEINKVWRTSDYEKLAEVLNSFKKKNFYSLPMFESENSGVIFSKIISVENIDTLFHDQKNGNADLIKFFNSYQKLLALYLKDDENDYYHKELAELLIFIIKISNETLSNLDKLPNSNFAIEQKFKVENGYKNTIVGALEMQQIVKGFTEEDLQKFSMAVIESLNKNRNRLSEVTINEIKQKIEILIKTTESKTLQSNYTNWLSHV